MDADGNNVVNGFVDAQFLLNAVFIPNAPVPPDYDPDEDPDGGPTPIGAL